MLNRRLIALLLLVLMYETCNAKDNHSCAPSSCGNIRDIRYPFRLKADPQNCGHKSYELACQKNHTVLYLFSGIYYVHAINYNNLTIRVADAGVQKNNCSSLPRYWLSHYNFSVEDPYTWYRHTWAWSIGLEVSRSLVFMNCKNPVNTPLYVDTAPCINSTNSSLTRRKGHPFVKIGRTNASDVGNSCSVELMVLTSMQGNQEKNISYMDIHDELVYGFELSWDQISRGSSGIFHFVKVYAPLIRLGAWMISLIILITVLCCAKCLCGTPCVIAFLLYKYRRRHLSMYDNVEEFLRSKNNFMTISYSYSEISRMTRGFRDKIGEGGYGSVYKGKLRSGRLVAVKMLGKSKANGQEFINEVATIGRIYHVNVVQLIGYCFERSKRALVYDFMPNGSLDKYIFPQEGSITLSCKKLYEISLGVARGIEYLHRGCNMKILHFDIKPHNILLDENFTPKVSDFGLAKLHPVEDSFVLLTNARGTMGYMAPELFYGNVGGISYKADVYSFGMLLMEMVGRRKNLSLNAEHLSQIYFPSWVYDQIVDGKDIDIGNVIEEEKILAKKMIIVALWCIQFKTGDRPSMNKVVEMLEAEVDSLQMPPKPFLSPHDNSIEDVKNKTNQAGPSIISGNSTGSTV